MSDFNALGPGLINGAGDRTALYLKTFSGEVLAVFNKMHTMMDKQMIRTLTQGKSAQFPVFGAATAEYHTPGVELIGNEILGGERLIYIDKRLIAHVGVDDLEEKMAHWDLRKIYANQLGQSLADKFDYNSYVVGLLASRVAADALFTGSPGGAEVTEANALTDADALGNAIFSAAQKLDEAKVPQSPRYCALEPSAYWLLVGGTKALNRDWGGSGSYAKGTLPEVAGINIVKTVNAPFGDNVAADTSNRIAGVSAGNTYYGDFSTTASLVWHPDAVGTVKLRDITPTADWIADKRITLLAAEMAIGTGIVRPECAVEIVTA
jgi:hypothetical protein